MDFIKALIPKSVLKFIRPFYHGVVAIAASFYFGRPSEKLIVIGITGTTGKSTTVAMLAHILNFSGEKCGFSTTVNFFDGKNNFVNKHGLSMPGGWLLQKQLRQMVEQGCKYAVVECTSEGLAQNRHFGINFDVAIFTNLSYAHLEAHGTYGNYQQAKAKLFSGLAKGKKKIFFPEKMLGASLDDPMSGYFISFPAQKKFGLSFKRLRLATAQKVYQANFFSSGSPMRFEIDGIPFALNMLAEFNVKNAGLAAACAARLGIPLVKAAEALKVFYGVAGRMEEVPNNKGLTIIIDYGCEPASIKAAVEAAAQLPHKKLIHVFGSTGGHRDKAKRFIFGKTSAQFADYIIITNDDVYNSDPMEIAHNIEEGIESFKLRKPKHEIVLDRRQAIYRALSIAEKGDVVLITGKGSEQFLVLPNNKRIDWEDASVVKDEIAKQASS